MSHFTIACRYIPTRRKFISKKATWANTKSSKHEFITIGKPLSILIGDTPMALTRKELYMFKNGISTRTDNG